MAQTPQCELNDELEAAYIIGMVATGEQLFLCAEHGAHFGLTLALQTLDPAEIVNAAQAIGATPPADGHPEAPANRPARKRPTNTRKERAHKPAPPGLAETPAAGDDR